MVQHAVGVDQIEGGVWKRQLLGVLMDEASGQAAQCEVLLCELQVAGRQVDVGHPGAVARKLARSVPMPPPISRTSSPAWRANSMTSGIHGPYYAVAMRLDLPKPLERVPRRARRVVRPERIVVPLPLDFFLVASPVVDAAAAAALSRTWRAQRRPRVFDMPPPRVVDRPRPAARCAEGLRDVGALRETNVTASTNSSTLPGSHNTARSRHRRAARASSVARSSAGDRTSPSCSSSLATMPPPIAMYSNSLVGEPKNLLSTMWLLWGDT